MPVRTENDVVLVRQLVRSWASEMRFSLVDQTKLVTAASELARNALIYGGGGDAHLDMIQKGDISGLRLIVEDQGPGIPDIEQAMKDGFTSGKGMGLGLGGTKRLVNEFSIETAAGQGTRVSIIRWR